MAGPPLHHGSRVGGFPVTAPSSGYYHPIDGGPSQNLTGSQLLNSQPMGWQSVELGGVGWGGVDWEPVLRGWETEQYEAAAACTWLSYSHFCDVMLVFKKPLTHWRSPSCTVGRVSVSQTLLTVCTVVSGCAVISWVRDSSPLGVSQGKRLLWFLRWADLP